LIHRNRFYRCRQLGIDPGGTVVRATPLNEKLLTPAMLAEKEKLMSRSECERIFLSPTMWASIVVLAFGAMCLALAINRNMELKRKERDRRAAMPPHELQALVQNEQAIADINRRAREDRSRLASDTFNHGAVNCAMVCPHCNSRGSD
jgi:hypothetical protein